MQCIHKMHIYFMLSYNMEYNDTRVELLAILLGQRAATVIQRLVELISDLNRNEMSNITANVRSPHVLIAFFNANGLFLLRCLQHTSQENGESIQMPTKAKFDHWTLLCHLTLRQQPTSSSKSFDCSLEWYKYTIQ